MTDTKMRESAREAAADGLTSRHVAQMIREQGSVLLLHMEGDDGYDQWPGSLYAVPKGLPEYVAWKAAEKACAAKVKEAHAARIIHGNIAYTRGLREARALETEECKARRSLIAWVGAHALPVEHEIL